MSTSNKYYTVSRTGNGLACSCLGNQYHKVDCKHIHAILDIIKQNRSFTNNDFKIMMRAKLNLCKYCRSDNMIKKGVKKNKRDDMQKYQCQ